MGTTLSPQPLNARYRRAIEPASTESHVYLERLPLPPYSAETIIALGDRFGVERVSNGGTKALADALTWFDRLGFGSERQLPLVSKWLVDRGAAHLREQGIPHRIETSLARPNSWRIVLMPGSTHPFDAVLRRCAKEGIALVFDPAALPGGALAGAHRDHRAINIGPHELHRLDPASSVIVHEEAHLLARVRLGSGPYAASFQAGRPGTSPELPGCGGFIYRFTQGSDEPRAVLAEAEACVAAIAKQIRDGEDSTAHIAWLADVVLPRGIYTALRCVAASKQSAFSIEDRSAKWIQVVDSEREKFVPGLAVRRPNGRAFDAVFYDAGIQPLFTALDTAFSGYGELGAISRGRMLNYFSWLTRVTSEQLALFRVAHQAADALIATRDPKICDAVSATFAARRAESSAKAAPVTYKEALATFNAQVARRS